MFELTEVQLKDLAADITTREIKQQPQLWQETKALYLEHKMQIQHFICRFRQKFKQKIRVIFTGAGSSAYIGDTIAPFLNRKQITGDFYCESIPTTEIVSFPNTYLQADSPTLLVSFARSGNSPESVAAVALAKQIVPHLACITITCAKEGKLSQAAKMDPNHLLLWLPKEANDAAFAMTGSYSSMALMGLLIFDPTKEEQKIKYVDDITVMGKELLGRELEISRYTQLDFKRIIYLGSGSLKGLAQEAQLKVLELTAGKVVTMSDSSLGFRHGPKSFIDSQTLVFMFLNNHPYPRQYDLDLMHELNRDQIAKCIVGIGFQQNLPLQGENFFFTERTPDLPEGYMALPDVMFAQTIALHCAIKVNNKPDFPSPNGTVNRVVKGVAIHRY